jgi:hypothetical protein
LPLGPTSDSGVCCGSRNFPNTTRHDVNAMRQFLYINSQSAGAAAFQAAMRHFFAAASAVSERPAKSVN